MRPLLAAAAVGLCLTARPVAARPFTIEDLLKIEDVGPAAFSRDGRWLVVERQRPYDQTADFGIDSWARLSNATLWVADTRSQHPALEHLIDTPTDAGDVAGPLSPDGQRMVFHRLQNRTWRAGVVDLASRRIKWLHASAERSAIAQVVIWADDATLLMISPPEGEQPQWLTREMTPAQRIPALWSRAATGGLSGTVVGGGAYLEGRASAPKRRLIRIALDEDDTQVLAEGPFIDMELSPSGDRLALLTQEEDLQPSGAKLLSATMPYRIGVSVLDLATRQLSSPCHGCDVLPHLLQWSPSGRRLAVFARRAGELWALGRFMLLTNGGAERTTQSAWLDYHVTTGAMATGAWAGERFYYLTKEDDRRAWRSTGRGGARPSPDAALMATDPQAVYMRESGAVWRYDEGGARTLVSKRATDFSRSRGFLEGARAARTPAFADFSRFGAANRGEVAAVCSGRSTILAQRAAFQLTRCADDRGVVELVLQRPSKRPLTVATLNGRLSAVDPVKIVPIRHPGPEGRPLVSWAFLPSAVGPKPPVVVLPYPGPERAVPSASFLPGADNPMANVQVLVGAGFAVIQPSLPLAAGDRQAIKRIGQDIVRIAEAADTQGLVDSRRIAIWGHSFGGYTAMMAATQSPRFSSIIAAAGIYDLASVRNISTLHERVRPYRGMSVSWMAGWTEDGQANMAGPPWRYAADYVANSPVYAADKVCAPVLLIHNDLDYSPPSQAEEMFSALYVQGKDVQLVTYWGEAHAVRSTQNLRDLYARTIAWLRRGFQRGEPPICGRSAPSEGG